MDLSPTSWGRVYLGTVIGTLACVAVALGVDSLNFPQLAPPALARAIAVDIIVPVILALPMLFFLLGKLRELAIAHQRLTIYASTDSLTSVLNRGAFTTLVEAYLGEVKAQERETRGALLVVDADNFKRINDSFGHDRGDEALQIIAGSIRGVLRAVDLVGRIGGEEFAVFLPGTSPIQAEAVAERIRGMVEVAPFVVGGMPRHLSVSVGGAVFDRRLPFNELFRQADQQLYLAKQNGRNRIAVSPIEHYDAMPAAAA